MRAVDTNVLVRLITRDHPEQAEIAEDFVAQGVWASLIVIAETIGALRTVYRFSTTEMVKTLEMLLTQRQLTIEDSDVVTAAFERFRSTPSVGFSDCLILELARKAGHLPLGTFDRAFGKLPGAYLL
jgi:predicted nucleic-acid-binding protein